MSAPWGGVVSLVTVSLRLVFSGLGLVGAQSVAVAGDGEYDTFVE